MPIYEYQCKACSNQFEYLLLPTMDQKALPECPSCQGKDVERVLSICAVSSENTRQTNLQHARKLNSRITKEKQDAEFKEMIHHANEHH